MKPKNKKIISDMVAKPATRKTSSTHKISGHEAVHHETPIHHKVFQEPTYQEIIGDDVFEEEEDFSMTDDTISYSHYESIDMDAILGEKRKYGGCLLWFIAFLCAIGIVLGIGAFFARAHITITPKSWTGSVDQTITLAQNPNVGQMGFATETQVFTDDLVVSATGVSDTSSKASGLVRLYNTNTTSRTIPAGTVLVSNNNISYTTTKKITIPAATKKTPGQADGKIVALDDGSDANDGLDDFTITSKNLAGITAHSLTPLSGGSSANTQTADPDQVAAAQAQIAQYFSDPSVFINRMTNEIPSAMIVLPIQIAPANPTITTNGDGPEGVHVIGSESITLLLVSKSDIAQSLGKDLDIPPDILVTLSSFDNLTVTTATALAAGAIPQAMSIHVSGTALITGLIDVKKLQTSLIGVSRKQAHHLLDTTPEIQAYTFKLTPFWRRILPIKQDQVMVNLK